jgi:hypothetical protein
LLRGPHGRRSPGIEVDVLITCEVCDGEIDLEDAFVWDEDGDLHYYCSEECMVEAGEKTPVDAGWVEDDKR